MSYFVVSISNGGGAPEQAYRKMQSAGACPERPYAGEYVLCSASDVDCSAKLGCLVTREDIGLLR